MYVELDTCQTSRKQYELDIETLRTEVNRLSNEKLSFVNEIRQSMAENELHLKEAREAETNNRELSTRLDRIKAEKETLTRELVEVKMKTAREKEELAQSLEQIEKEIVRREREAYARQYEAVLMQSCEAVRADEARKYAQLCEQIRQRYAHISIAFV